MLSPRDAIAALIFTYAERLDAGDLAGVAALFADAAFRSTQGGNYRGSAEVLDVMTKKVILYADGTPRTKHVTTNVIVDMLGDESATARSYFTVLQATERLALQPVIAGRYADRFVCERGTWRFADRLVLVDLVGDLSQHVRS